MDKLEELSRRFYLQKQTTKDSYDDIDMIPNIMQENYWQTVLDMDIENARMREYFKELSQNEREGYLSFAISCLMCFVQANFTGPELPHTVDEFLAKDMFKTINFCKRLGLKTGDINPNTKYPALLVVSEIIFDSCIVHTDINVWWCCRSLMIHQDIMDEPSPSFHAYANCVHKYAKMNKFTGRLQAEFHIELAQLYLRFRNKPKYRMHIDAACDILGVEYRGIGRFHKQYQHDDGRLISLLEVEGLDRPEIDDDYEIPRNVPVRTKNKTTETPSADGIKLPISEQKLIITLIQSTLIAKPLDKVKLETILPFIEMLINQKKCDKKEQGLISRCLAQCEHLLNCFNKTQPHPMHRILDCFAVAVPPIWKVQTLQAVALMNYELINDSITILHRIQRWDALVTCGNKSKKSKKKVIMLLRKQMVLKPTVPVLCALGDATDDLYFFEEAWNLSKRRSHLAKKYWGLHYCKIDEYDEAMLHLEKSLSINPLQCDVWLTLGHAARKVMNWQTAATAYRRVLALEPESMEALEHLLDAYKHLNNPTSAQRALRAALEDIPDEIILWERFMKLSIEVGNCVDAVAAYNRLQVLDREFNDFETLSVIVCKNNAQARWTTIGPRRRLFDADESTRQLVGKLVVQHPRNPLLWELHACLAPVLMLKAHRLQRALRYYTVGNWDSDVNICLLVINICSKLADVALNNEVDPADYLVCSVRTNIHNALRVVETQPRDEIRSILLEVRRKDDRLRVKKAGARLAFRLARTN